MNWILVSITLSVNGASRQIDAPTCSFKVSKPPSGLTPVPGGQSASSDRWEGPSGVLVCCEDHIIWKHPDADAHRIPIPRRRNPLVQKGENSRGIIIVAAVMHKIRVSLRRFMH